MSSKSWRLAGSLVTLRKQIDLAWSKRSKVHDGTVGDAAHAARASDHNPNSVGVVCALDITHDPRSGCDAELLAKALQAARDPRVKYVIWNGQIMSGSHSDRAWVWRPYTGVNPHRTHLHVSVVADAKRYDDAREWLLPGRLRLMVNGREIAGMRIEAGVSYAPVRALAEALGARVEFDGAWVRVSFN